MNDLALYDVIAVNMETHKVLVLDVNKSLNNAEAIIKFAVMRRGVDTEFFIEAPCGKYRDGMVWTGEDE